MESVIEPVEGKLVKSMRELSINFLSHAYQTTPTQISAVSPTTTYSEICMEAGQPAYVIASHPALEEVL